ncbi:MAG: helix-turn-helix transcriptional regulator [Patescibacteria group bacterium]
MRNKLYTLEDHIKESLKDPAFRKVWEESETEYQLGRILIGKRLAKNISQRELAKKAHTTQAVISRIESMNSNPSLELLKRIAVGLGTKLKIGFE